MRRLAGLALTASLVATATLGAQQRRDSLVAAADAEFDAARRVQLLVPALAPALGPPDAAWNTALQLLAQTLMDQGRQSAAVAWLRWGLRLAPDLQPDTVRFLPQVIAAYQAAQDLVTRTRSPDDSLAPTTWRWPVSPAGYAAVAGSLRVTAPAAERPVSVVVIGTGPLALGAAVPLAPGSYAIRAAAGSDSVQVTREALPGVTTTVELRLPPPPVAGLPPGVAPRPPPPNIPAQPPLEPKRHKGFPWLWVALGAAGAGAAAAILAGGGSNPPQFGSITITFPNP